MIWPHDKRVRPRGFKEGDLVLIKILPSKEDHHGMLKPNFEGPYVLTKFSSSGVLFLSDVDGDLPHELVNFDS